MTLTGLAPAATATANRKNLVGNIVWSERRDVTLNEKKEEKGGGGLLEVNCP